MRIIILQVYLCLAYTVCAHSDHHQHDHEPEKVNECLFTEKILSNKTSGTERARLLSNLFDACLLENATSIKTAASFSLAKFNDLLKKSVHDLEHDNHDQVDKKKNVDHEQAFNSTCLEEKFADFKSVSGNFASLNRNVFVHLSSLLAEASGECQIASSKSTDINKKEGEFTIKENWIFAFASATVISLIGILCYLVVPSIKTQYFNTFFQFLVALAVGTLSGDSLLHLIPHAFMEHSFDETGQGEVHGDHTAGIFKGLSALTGIYLFFLIEKTMQIRRVRKEKRHRQSELNAAAEKLSININFNRNNEIVKTNSLKNHASPNGGTSLCTNSTNVTNKISVDEMASPDEKAALFSKSEIQKQQQEHQAINSIGGDQSCYVIHANKDLKYISQYLPNNKCTENVDHHDSEKETEHLHRHGPKRQTTSVSLNHMSDFKNTSTNTKTKLLVESPIASNASPCLCSSVPNLSDSHDAKHKLPCTLAVQQENHDHSHQAKNRFEVSSVRTASGNKMMEPDEHDAEQNAHTHHSHHGHHMHGHSHKNFHIYKSSREKAHHDHHKMHEKEISDIKLIAWMVLMGDGLHNFADGLAIGASFAVSLTTGFGTSIAVLCHELPHEIGDFAVLRRAGVSLKRALVFNAISALLCLVGVLVGLLIGGFENLKNLSFLFIAGTFLYISLVDMIPELSEKKEEDDSFWNFFIQSMGILTGIGIMLLIALMEDSITNIFK